MVYLGQTSAYVPALQKYSGPQLKSLRKKPSLKDEEDDEDEEAKVKSRKRVPDKRASAKDGRDDEDKEAQGNVQKRMSRKGVSSKKEPEDKVNEISESAQRRRASSKPQEPEDEDEDSRKQSASNEDPEDRDNGPKVNTQKSASGNRAVSKEGQEDEDKEEGKTKKRGRHNPTTAAAQDKGSSAVTLGNAESKHGKGRPPKSINGNVSKATDVKPLTEVSTTRSLGSLGKVAKDAEEGHTTRASRRVDATHGKTMAKLEAK
jgi:hypothetical protein